MGLARVARHKDPGHVDLDLHIANRMPPNSAASKARCFERAAHIIRHTNPPALSL
jgi:hypothetical protein